MRIGNRGTGSRGDAEARRGKKELFNRIERREHRANKFEFFHREIREIHEKAERLREFP
jgi:hypothetical protein